MRRKHISLLLVTAVTFLRTNAAPLASKFDENEAISSSFQDHTNSVLDSFRFQIEPSSSFLDMQSSVLFSNRFVMDDVDGSHLSSLLNEVYLEPTSSSHFHEGSSSYAARPNDILQPLVVQLAESMLSDLNYRVESSVLAEALSSSDAMSSLAKSPSSILESNILDDDLELTHYVHSKAVLVSKTPDVQQGFYTSSPTLLDESISSSYQFQKSSSPYLHSIRYSAQASKTPDLPEESHVSFQMIASALLLNDVASHHPVLQQDDLSSTEIKQIIQVVKSSSIPPNLLSSTVKPLQNLAPASQTPELPELSNLPFEVIASALLLKGTTVDQLNDLSNTELHHSSKFSSSIPSLHSSLFKTLLKSTPSSRTPELPEVSNLPFQAIASALLPKGTSVHQKDEFTSEKLHPSLTRTFRPSALRITPSPKPSLASPALSLIASDAAIASSFFDSMLSSISAPNSIAESPYSSLVTGLNEPISSMMTELQAEPSSGMLLSQMHTMLYNADLLRSSIVKNTPAFSNLIQPTPSQLSTATSSLVPETDQFTHFIKTSNLSLVQPNNSAVTVDKIIEGLMNIIRPLNSQNLLQSTLLPSILTIPELKPLSTEDDQDATGFIGSSQLLQALHKFYLTPSVDHRTPSKSTIKPQILPSSTSFVFHPSNDVPHSLASMIPPLAIPNANPSPEQFDISVIQAILHQEDDRTTTQGVVNNDIGTQGQRPEFSHFDKPEVVTFNSRPGTIRPLSTPSFSQPKPAITTPIFNSRRPWKRPSSTRSTPKRTTRTPTSSTPKRPTILAFGEAKPIVLDLFDNDSSDAVNSRLPSTGSSSPLVEESQTGHIEATIGSNVLKIKEKIPTLRPPTRKPSLQFVSSQFHFDGLVSSTNEPPSVFGGGRPLVRPSHHSSAPAIIPLRVTTPSFDADQPVEMDHANNQHNVISSQATFFIRPTSASSSIVRQTIFQTVVSISDSTDEFAHFHDEVPMDDPTQNVLAAPPSSPSSPSVGLVEHNHEDVSAAASDTSGTLSNAPTITTTTARPSTPTARPTTTTARPTTITARSSTTIKATTRTTKATTTTSKATTIAKKPTTTKRPLFVPLRSSTRRRVRWTTTKRPIADAPTIMVTKRPSRPGQTLLNFGYSLIPAVVIGAIVGLPLVIAGKKKRDVGSENDFVEKLRDITEFIEEMSQPVNSLKSKAFRRRSLKNMKSKWR